MRTRVKVCCLNSYQEALSAIELGADALGFVGVAPPSPRTLSDTAIAEIVSLIPPPISTFLLSSHYSSEKIIKQLQTTNTSAVQLVTAMIDVAEIGQLQKSLPGVSFVKVIHVEDECALNLIDHYSPYIHAFLLDTGSPNLATPEYGGTGRVHDWSISAEFVRRSHRPVFLAGGLTENNVGDAINIVRPFCVDLCSGVRTDGHLDRDKLSNFIDAVRKVDAELNGS